eukprot:871697-Amphidinium_carterae.1
MRGVVSEEGTSWLQDVLSRPSRPPKLGIGAKPPTMEDEDWAVCYSGPTIRGRAMGQNAKSEDPLIRTPRNTPKNEEPKKE